MKAVIVGGRLQGVEAAYLARKAGWEVVLVDRDIEAPGGSLCDRFLSWDIVQKKDWLKQIDNVDIVIPALESHTVLGQLQVDCQAAGVPLAFDQKSFSISSSKLKSDRLFRDNSIPVPVYWPEVKLPVIVKPSSASGSQGVRIFHELEDLDNFLRVEGGPGEWVIQEYLLGPSYSLEVMGLSGEVISYQVTGLEMDFAFDCKRVLAPLDLDFDLENKFRQISADIARLINLTGIMDVEVINHRGVLKVLEIDARLPSQTPTVVLKSTGQNMLAHLSDVYLHHRLPEAIAPTAAKAVSYEHIRVSTESLETLGEHIMGDAGPLSLRKDFFGADEALTNYCPGLKAWVATLIFTGENRVEVEGKRQECFAAIQKLCNVPRYLDSSNPLEVCF